MSFITRRHRHRDSLPLMLTHRERTAKDGPQQKLIQEAAAAAGAIEDNPREICTRKNGRSTEEEVGNGEEEGGGRCRLQVTIRMKIKMWHMMMTTTMMMAKKGG